MRKRQTFWDRLDENIPDSVSALNQPIVEIAGHKRVLIESHRGIVCYNTEKITVRVAYGSVSVCGCGLKILHMNREQLVISGSVHNVTLYRRESL